MTLKEAIHLIESIASWQPAVNMIVRSDIFRLNSFSDAKYGVFAWVQGQHSAEVKNSLMTLQFTFIYADRLTSTRDNLIDVQSEGMTTLDNICRTLNDYGIAVDAYNFQPFNQRFLDECAGVFSNVVLRIPITTQCVDSVDVDEFGISEDVEVR